MSRIRVIPPYIRGTTDRIAKVLRRKHVEIAFSPPNSLRNMLDNAKDLIDPKMRKGIYSIPYLCGKIYIGESSRSMKVRLKEHCADIIHDRTKKSAMAEHSHKSNHKICIEDAKVIVMEDHYNK